jgi:hypothetical protein
MRRAEHNPGLPSRRVSSLLVSTLNAAALLLASAVSGIAIALHLAAAPQTSEHHPLRGAAATPPAIAAAPMDEPKIVTAELPATGQARDEAAPAVVSDASANKPRGCRPVPRRRVPSAN